MLPFRFGRVARIGTVGSVIRSKRGVSVGTAGDAIVIGGSPFAMLSETKANGTDCGSASANSWHRRNLNVVDYVDDAEEDVPAVVLASYQFTVSPGIFMMTGFSTMNQVAQCRAAVYNVTAAAYQIIGKNSYASSAAASGVALPFMGIVTVSDAPNVFELRTYGTVARATTGLGAAVSIGTQIELYSAIEIRRLQ